MLNARDSLGCDRRHPAEKWENEIRKERETTTQPCMNKHVLGGASVLEGVGSERHHKSNVSVCLTVLVQKPEL